LVCMFDGIRMYSAVLPGCEGCDLVGRLDKMMILDDQAVAFAAGLKRCSSFTVTELKDPARIVIEVIPAVGCPDERVWSLRSRGAMRGEMIGHFQEKLGHLGGAGAPRELHGAGGAIVEEGIYATREEAEERKAALSLQGIEMIVEVRGMFDRPEIGEE
ncbi:MAG TPA: hypothetical protein VLA34_04515, partial [Candidatus Krumholzibacterium sp.]|nr:hypothetical protein [Candidatus Krumholzibacterium sp.]